MSNFTDRVVRAAKPDVNLYEEIEAHKQAMVQAMGVVVRASLAAGTDRLLIGPVAAPRLGHD